YFLIYLLKLVHICILCFTQHKLTYYQNILQFNIFILDNSLLPEFNFVTLVYGLFLAKVHRIMYYHNCGFTCAELKRLLLYSNHCTWLLPSRSSKICNINTIAQTIQLWALVTKNFFNLFYLFVGLY